MGSGSGSLSQRQREAIASACPAPQGSAGVSLSAENVANRTVWRISPLKSGSDKRLRLVRPLLRDRAWQA